MSRAHVVVAILFLFSSLAFAQNPNAPDANTGREGGEDLLKELAFSALDEALGASGGRIDEIGGKPAGITGGRIIGFVDDVIIDPLLAVAQTDGDNLDKFKAFVQAASIGGLKVVWTPYGLTVDGGKLIVGTSIDTVDKMIAAGNAQQVEAILFGRGAAWPLGALRNPLADQNFFSLPGFEARGLTADRIGETITNTADLKKLWYGEYRYVLVGNLLQNAAEVDAALNAAYPRLEEFWQARRATIVAERFAARLSRALLIAQERARVAEEFGEGHGDITVGEGGDADDVFGQTGSDFVDESEPVEDLDGDGLPDVILGDDDTLPDDVRLPQGEEIVDGGEIEGDGNDGTPLQPPTPPPPPATLVLSGQIWDLVETKPDAVFDTWQVAPGSVSVSGYGYRGDFDWSSPPAAVGAEGFSINLSVTCQTEKGQRFATGIGASSGFKAEPKPAVECNADIDDSQAASVDVLLTPPQGVAPGTEIELKVGAFWGLGVTYKYRAR